MTIFAALKSKVKIMQSYIDLQSITARIEQESGLDVYKRQRLSRGAVFTVALPLK